MIVNMWPDWFRSTYGGEWPESYVTWDLETTGYDKHKDYIVEIGHCIVKDRKVVDRLSTFIDWSHFPGAHIEFMQARINKLNETMYVSKGLKPVITYERLCREGKPPEKVFSFYAELFGSLIEKNVIFAGHNVYTFDEPFYQIMTERMQLPAFRFDENDLFDTDILERGNQLLTHPRFQPVYGDSLRSYFSRSMYVRGVKSNLHTHCFEKYGFGNAGINPTEMHRAATDAFCVHLLMEKFRALIKPPMTNTNLTPWAPDMPAPSKSIPIERQQPVVLRVPPRAPGEPPRRIRGQRNS